MRVAIFSVLLTGCGTIQPHAFRSSDSLDIDFGAGTTSDGGDHTAASDTGLITIALENQRYGITIISSHAHEKVLSKRIDASAFRNMRILATVNTRFRPRGRDAFASMRLSVDTGAPPNAWNSATSLNTTGSTDQFVQVALDVPSDAALLRLDLIVTGAAEANFDTPHIEVTARSPARSASVTSDMISSLRSLAQLVGYLRFFHPSDQVANTSWPTFEAEAVNRLLATRNNREAIGVLRWVAASVAPTARLRELGHDDTFPEPPKGSGAQLTRWIRIGSGNDGDPYLAFRSGIVEPADVGITLLKTAPAQGCRHATLTLSARAEQGSPEFELHILPRDGSGFQNTISHVVRNEGAIDADIPSGTTAIMFGVRIGGVGSAELADVVLSCDKKSLASFASISTEPEIWGNANHLYTAIPVAGCKGCFSVARTTETTYLPLRDEIHVGLGLGVQLEMPLALWTDGRQTFPAGTEPPIKLRPLPPNDLASRIATAIDIWSTLRWFYPYLNDLHIDWDHELTESIVASARADSADKLLTALGSLVAQLHDDHASVYRAAYDNGVMPLLFHYLDSKLYFVGGIDEYKTVFPRGSILESIDGVSADAAIRQTESTISAATLGWLHRGLPLVLADGPAGRMISIEARRPDGMLVRTRVPRLDRSKHFLQKHEDRPANGSEVAPGIYYVNFDQLGTDSWRALLPKLGSAKGIICDTRDGASPSAFHVLAHLIDHEIKSPYWDKPIADPRKKRYERSQSSIYPSAPRLSLSVVFVVDGGTASSPETILQYAHAAGLGTVVGEQTGGTNGNVATFESLGGITVRFTGTRTLNQDNSEFHGRGITPDLVVHPTAAGVRAGRDEILEAAIARLAAP